MLTALLRLPLILTSLVPSVGASEPLEDLARKVLLSPNEPPGMITDFDAAGCIVRLKSREPGHAVIKFGNIDPDSIELRGRGRDTYLRLWGSEPVISVTAADGTTYEALSFQITASRNGHALAALREIASECSGVSKPY